MFLFFLIPETILAKPIKFGFVGGKNPVRIVKDWSPLLDYLQKEVGEPFQMVLREDYEGLIEAIKNNEIDIFEGGAFSHVKAIETGKADIFVGEFRHGKYTYHSTFIVRQNDNINSIEDLKNKRFAFTDELSTSGYLIPRVILAEENIKKPHNFFSQIVLTGSHDRSISALLEGAVDGIAVGNFFYKQLPKHIQDKLKIIRESPQIPTGPITGKLDFDPTIREKIIKAFLEYKNKVPESVKHIIELDHFFLQNEADFDIIRKYQGILSTLPPLKYTPPYRKIPTVFEDKISSLKYSFYLWMLGILISVTIILAVISMTLRKRFSTSIGIFVAIISFIFALLFTIVQTISLNSNMHSFAKTKIKEMENINLRSVAALADGSSIELNRVAETSRKNSALEFIRIFKNGTIIASSTPDEVGTSIINQIRANTFAPHNKNTIQVLDPIMLKNRKAATLQFGISFSEISKKIDKSIILNIIIMLGVLIAGFISTIFARKLISKPFSKINKALKNIREGEIAHIETNDKDVNNIANSVQSLSKEISDTKHLLELRNTELSKNKVFDPIITNELGDKIKLLENENPKFKKIRTFEAIGNSPAMLRTLRDSIIRSKDKDPVLVFGPTGSGKTGIAKSIHALSPRSDKPFVEFNCAEFASGDPLVILGKLFGYGTNSGLQGIDKNGQKGILEEYDGGTIFFDEVEIIPHQAQQLLLLPLEGRPFNPASGKSRPKTANVRFIFATNEPIDQLQHSGKLRNDFLRRIQTRGTVNVYPLSERREDIEPLATYFLAKLNKELNKNISLSQSSMTIITQQNYSQYNISELSSIINKAFDHANFDSKHQILMNHLSDLSHDIKIEDQNNLNFTLDDEEQNELSVLRSENFNISQSELKLGFSTGSKTLTNRFRGLAYKIYSYTNMNIESTVKMIAGNSLDKRIEQNLNKKISDYIENIKKHKREKTTDKLFNNLPQKYHHFVELLLNSLK